MPSEPPPHLRPTLWLVVWLGGASGTGVRYLLGRVVPHVHQVPVATLGINVLGAFVLGVLLALLARRRPETGRRRVLRLLLGTGFLGGFTTYSALAVDTVSLSRAGLGGWGLAYAAGTVLLGALAAWLGVLLGSARSTPERDASA